jgi:FixJ family two-component response regulator
MAMEQPRIAVVDDDMSVRKALARLLTASSFEIRTYGSARDFMVSLENDPRPQCVIVDLHMPEMTGLDLQKSLFGLGIKIPTIIITAYNEPGISQRCRDAGAAAFLLKPIASATLIDAINAAIRTTALAGARRQQAV